MQDLIAIRFYCSSAGKKADSNVVPPEYININYDFARRGGDTMFESLS